MPVLRCVPSAWNPIHNNYTDSPLRNNKRKGKKKDDSKLSPSDDGGVHVGVDQEQEFEWDSNSSTLYNVDDDDDAKERKQGWSGVMESADARKAAKTKSFSTL